MVDGVRGHGCLTVVMGGMGKGAGRLGGPVGLKERRVLLIF